MPQRPNHVCSKPVLPPGHLIIMSAAQRFSAQRQYCDKPPDHQYSKALSRGLEVQSIASRRTQENTRVKIR